MHEVFHQVLHKNCFRREKPDYIHGTSQKALNGKKPLKTSLDFIEYQANTCAAAFLMPQDVVREEFKKRSNNLGSKYPLSCDYMVESIICDMADVFSVSKQAMRYRLNALNMVTFDATPFQFKIQFKGILNSLKNSPNVRNLRTSEYANFKEVVLYAQLKRAAICWHRLTAHLRCVRH